MQYKYGAYTHDAGEVSLNVSREIVRSGHGVRQHTKMTHAIKGWLRADDQTALDAKTVALEAA